MTVEWYLKRFVRYFLDYIAIAIGYFREPKRGLFYLPPITNQYLLEPAFSLAEKIREGKVCIVKRLTRIRFETLCA